VIWEITNEAAAVSQLSRALYSVYCNPRFLIVVPVRNRPRQQTAWRISLTSVYNHHVND
jgi:hypothetical protein